MKKQWRHYIIFISSTFRDMDEERDVIKLDVVKRLNRAYQDKFIQFQTVDLRVGINTADIQNEEERENRVLDVCLANIDNARPFFIGLLGERYGWVPDHHKWQYVISRLSEENKSLLKDSDGCSVTEMEILYGAIGNNGEYMNHSLFFLRDPSSYDLMPPELKPTYCDKANLALPAPVRSVYHQKLHDLKERIIGFCKQQNYEQNCINYTLQWNVDEGHFDGLNSFADLLFEKLSREVDAEIASEQLEAATWYYQEEQNAEYLHKKNTYKKAKRSTFDEASFVLSQKGQVLFSGAEGTGKTILLSQLYQHFSDDSSLVCLSAFVGTSLYSMSIRPIMTRWILALAQHLEKSVPDDTTLLNEKQTTLISLYDLFSTLVDELKAQGKGVCIFMDAIQLFEMQNKEDAYLPWLNQKVMFAGTVTPEFEEKATLYNSAIQCIALDELTTDELQQILENEERVHMIELPAAIKQDLLRRTISPLQLGMLMTLLTHLCTSDFRKIRSEGSGSEIEKINQYMYQLYKEAPEEHSELFLFVIRFLMKNLRVSEHLMQLFAYIAASGNGLRESDLERLMPEEWNPLDFHSLVYILDDFFIEDRISHNWHIKSFSLSSELIPKEKQALCELYAHLSDMLLTLDDNDPKKNDMLFYYLVRAHHIDGIRKAMIDDDVDMITERYSVSIQYLLISPTLVDDLMTIASGLQPGERVNFIYHFVIHGVPLFVYPELLWDIMNDEAMHVDVKQLNVADGYNLASLYREVFLLCKHQWIKCELEDTNRILQSCITCYEHCYKLDVTHRDSRNMLKGMLTEQITMYARTGHPEKIQETFLLINKI